MLNVSCEALLMCFALVFTAQHLPSAVLLYFHNIEPTGLHFCCHVVLEICRMSPSCFMTECLLLSQIEDADWSVTDRLNVVQEKAARPATRATTSTQWERGRRPCLGHWWRLAHFTAVELYFLGRGRLCCCQNAL